MQTNLIPRFPLKVAATISLTSWLLCLRFLFPLPHLLLGDASDAAMLDFVRWLVMLVMTLIGVGASWRLLHKLSAFAVASLGLSVLIYIGLRIGFEGAIYVRFWRDLLHGRLISTLEVIGNATGWGSTAEFLLFTFVIPCVLLGVLFYMLAHLTTRTD